MKGEINMSKLGNTLAMLKILETGRKYTVNELSSMIEVSPRMIKTYKAELEKAGIYIETINGIYGGYVYNHKNNYDVSFSINDVSCLNSVFAATNLPVTSLASLANCLNSEPEILPITPATSSLLFSSVII